MIQTFDHDTTDGVIIFGRKFGAQRIVDVIELHGTGNIIGIGTDFLDQLFLFGIILITDLTNDFFQQVLKRDQTDSRTVFI